MHTLVAASLRQSPIHHAPAALLPMPGHLLAPAPLRCHASTADLAILHHCRCPRPPPPQRNAVVREGAGDERMQRIPAANACVQQIGIADAERMPTCTTDRYRRRGRPGEDRAPEHCCNLSLFAVARVAKPTAAMCSEGVLVDIHPRELCFLSIRAPFLVSP